MVRYLNCVAAVILPSLVVNSFNFLTNVDSFQKDLLRLVNIHPSQAASVINQHTPVNNFNSGVPFRPPKLNKFSLSEAVTATTQSPTILVPVESENGEKLVAMMSGHKPIVFPDDVNENIHEEYREESPLFRESILSRMFHDKKQRNK